MNPFHWRLTNLYSIGTHLFQVFLCFLLIIPKRSRQPRPVKYFDGLSLLVNLGAITSQSQQFPRRALTISSHNAMSYCNVHRNFMPLTIEPSEMQNMFNGSLCFLGQSSLFFHFIPNQLYAMSHCNFQYICFLLAIGPSEMQNIFHGSQGFLEQYSLFFHFIPNQLY